MSIEQLKQSIANEPAPEGWEVVSADRWADFTSDFRTTATERTVEGRDSMMCAVHIGGKKLDVSIVQYIYYGGGVIKRYLISPTTVAYHKIPRVGEEFYPRNARQGVLR